MTVFLVGAGPGDPELLTVRAARLLATADVVIHDRLLSRETFKMIAPWAECIDVGKDPNGHSVAQSEINRLLVAHGLRFDTVVRLKGGDPYVFGRGGEEALALHTAGVATEVVPGISSAIAGPAAAGIPLTHRGVSAGFTVITATQRSGADDPVDWQAAAQLGTTLVVLMGARRADQIRTRLLLGGADPSTPVAVVTRATFPDQCVERCALDELGRTMIENPSIIIIGAVAALELAHISSSYAGSLHTQGVRS